MNRQEQLTKNLRNLVTKLELLNKQKIGSALQGYKPSEVHFIEYVGHNTDSNATKLAESFYMTNGAITKIYQKLVEKDIIESYRHPGNRKEIYFRLTAKGQEVFDLHESLHLEFMERDRAVFDRITNELFDNMLHFTEIYDKHLDDELNRPVIKLTPVL